MWQELVTPGFSKVESFFHFEWNYGKAGEISAELWPIQTYVKEGKQRLGCVSRMGKMDEVHGSQYSPFVAFMYVTFLYLGI